MFGTAQPGHVLKDSGTNPTDVAEKPIFNEQPKHTKDSLTKPDILRPVQNNASFSHVTAAPSSDVSDSNRPGTAVSCADENGDAAKPGFIQHCMEDLHKTFDDARLYNTLTTDSHALALQEHQIKGEIQKQPILPSGAEVTDLGWHKSLADMPQQLIGGISNESLFALIRRFNKDVFDVRAVPLENTSGLDLTEAWADDHASDKITLNLQRAYLSIVLGLASLMKQVSRLRSWNETRRTAAFCTAYFIAWILNFLVPLLLGTLFVVIGSNKARNALFPPAPLALVNTSTGGLQKPQAGQLGTIDTLTGAPEKVEGEAREEEAANFVDNFRHVIARAIGMHDNKDDEGNPLQAKVPMPVQKIIKSVKSAGSAPGHATDMPGKDMTQEPMEELLWEKAKPEVIEPVIKFAPHLIGAIVDDWERFANAISPIAPFSPLSFLHIEAVLALLFLASLFLSSYMVYKGIGGAIGFGMFGDPIISRGLIFLNAEYPRWKEILKPKNHIFRGVPTNNQLTLTLLRIGEAHNSPIPPVPSTKATDANKSLNVQIDQVPLAATEHEVLQAVEPSPMRKGHGDHSFSVSRANSSEAASEGKKEKPEHRYLSRIVSFAKGNTKATVNFKLAIDHVRAAAGSQKAKGHLGVLPRQKDLIYTGPAEFKARYEGKKGWLCITSLPSSGATSSTTAEPCLVFTNHDPCGQHGKIDASDNSEIRLCIALKDMHRVKRATAFASMVAERTSDWSEDTDLLGSVEVSEHGGKTWRFTAIPERDELFNRLVAIGEQRWENI